MIRKLMIQILPEKDIENLVNKFYLNHFMIFQKDEKKTEQ